MMLLKKCAKTNIQVTNDERGCPHIKFYGGALDAFDALAHNMGQPTCHLSLSDDGDIAQAFVVLSLKNL